MIIPANEKEVRQFAQDSVRDATHDRHMFGSYASRCRCYYIGSQWIQQDQAPLNFQRLVREATNWVGQAGPIRATINRTTKHAIQVASATSPEKLWVDGLPPDHAEGIMEVGAADIMETLANSAIDDAGLLSVARRANFERTIDGAHGIGLAMDTWDDTLDINGGQTRVTNRKVRAFDFDFTRLTLDPNNQSHRLRDHDSIIYSEVFTENKLRKFFGDDVMNRIDAKSLSTIGSLMPVEMQFHTLSGGAMYAPYHAYRHTKGALVHFLHFRSASGRYDTQFAVIEAKPVIGKDMDHIVVGMDDPRSPWGGDGLPYVVLYGHHRPMSRMPVSDVGMMIDDQDKLNLTASMYFQQLYDFTQYSYLVDKRWFGARADDNSIREQMNSRVIIGDNAQSGKEPELMLRPQPSATVSSDMDRFEIAMREQAFRTESHQGKLKSHVTTTQFVGTNELTQIPLDDRITTDIQDAYEPIISVLAGTTIANLAASSPYTARLLTEAGLSPDDLGAISQMNPHRIPAILSIRQETVRRRSRSQRKQDLVDAVSIGALDPKQFAKTMASDLDMPLSSLDKQAIRYARDTARMVMMGQPFTPLPLGTYGDHLIDEFRRALMSDTAKRIPEAYQRLAQAIISQQEMLAMEMGQEQPTGQAGGSAPQGDPLQDASLDELLGGMTEAQLTEV